MLAAYAPVLRHRVLRRALPGIAASALGDGMSIVAVGWLALDLAPPNARATWLAAAVAAYSLPSALGGLLFARHLAHRSAATLTTWNAVLRAAALTTIVAAFALSWLTPQLYVTLLALSSLLAAWGAAGRYTLVAENLAPEHHLSANGILMAIGEFATIAGPPLAGLLIARWNAAAVLALDAASFAVLAATFTWFVPPSETRPPPPPTGPAPLPRALLTLSCAFFLLFGPFYTAMPIHVADDLHAPATLLAWYYTTFGIGSVLGALTTAHLRRLPLWPTTTATVALFGAAMLPLGLGAPAWLALPAFAVAGACWAPFLSLSMALFQRDTPPERLPRVLALYGSVTVVAVPLGTALGGPLVTTFGATRTLLISALGMLTLGAAAAASRRR